MELIKSMALIMIAHLMGASDLWCVITAFGALAFYIFGKIAEVANDD